MPLPMPLPMLVITRESPDALNDRCRWFSGDSLVEPESPRELLFKDRYFVGGNGSGIGGGIGGGIAKRFKDPAQEKGFKSWLSLPLYLFTVSVWEYTKRIMEKQIL